MEKKTNYYMEGGMPYGFENLTPLLKNEYRLQNGKNKHEKNFEKSQKKNEFSGNKPTQDLNVTKSINENSVDLVINVELRKHESNYMDAYYTDLDLQGRKAYHEYGKKQGVPKRDVLMNKLTKFSDLNLMFTDNVANYSPGNKQNCFFSSGNTKNVTDGNCSLEQLLHSAEENVRAFYGDYRNSKTMVKKSNRIFMKSGEKKSVKNWPPLYYTNVLSKKSPEKYDIAVNRYVPSKPENSRLMRINPDNDSGNSLSKASISYGNNKPKFKNDLRVPPLALNVCNKNAMSMKDVVSISNFSNCVSEHYQYDSDNRCENLAVTISDPEINQQRRQSPIERIQLRKMHSMEKFSENTCKIRMYEDQSYSRSRSHEYSRPSYESRYCDDNFCKSDNTDNEFNRLVVEQNSYISNTFSSSDACQLSQFKDKYYLKKKYHREQYHRCHLEKPVENSELSNILDIDDSCLLDFNPLKKSIQDESVNIKSSKTEMEQDQNQPCWLNPRKLSEKILVQNINLESTSKVKTLEVLFPVKSLRICMNEIDNNGGGKSDATDDPFVTSLTEVEVMKNTFIKKTELVKESVSKILSDRNCEITGNEELINIQLNRTLITREVNENAKAICTNNRNRIDLRMILNSNEFREEVLSIIERYLKENYLKDDNFDVIVVPRNEKTIEANPVDTLKRIISCQLCTSECDSVANEQNFELPDLSMFNPRDFKGHVAKYEKMYHDNPTIRSTNKSLKKKTLECSNCIQERNNRFRPATSKGMKVKPINVDEGCGCLTKYLSMPAFKLKSQKSSISIKNTKSFIRVSRERGTDGYENNIADCNDNLYQQYFISESSHTRPRCDVDCSSLLNAAKGGNKYEGSKFVTEFNEFKEIFDEVEVHHNALLHVLNYDPCGLLFKTKKCHFVSGKAKQLPNK